ncbi:MAG: cephalosporin hydroxylase [Desulfovibrio sp.]|nr:cephalosporin hydroxylase [Desulfovibrio sp.]
MSDFVEFEQQVAANIEALGRDKELLEQSHRWAQRSNESGYTYNFKWMGLPIIQYPQDMAAMQEIIWEVKPDLIIETGVARGGSLIFYASMLKMMDIQGGVVGVDIDIRPHNREAIENHPMAKYITLIQGSSIDEGIVNQVKKCAQGKKRVLVVLDSNHTHQHVLEELKAYAPLVTKGSYCVVFDTLVEDMPEGSFPDRPWDKGDNPKTAVWEYLKTTDRFEIDDAIHNKLQITVAPDGYLKCIKD